MKTYLVGGAVRDGLLNLEVKDRDYVVVGSDVQEMKDLGYKQVGKDFPVFLHPETHEEYALARTERKSGHGYTQFVCDFGKEVTLEQDLMRRDLTINAIAQDENGNYIDPCNGLKDIEKRILRHVSPAFVEDPLRVLRVARFAAQFFCMGFAIADETMELLMEMSKGDELLYLTPERVWIELHKALCSNNPEIFIELLHYVGALEKVLPWVERLYGVPAPAKWHPEIDTGLHTVMTLARVSQETRDPVTRFAMLCHDLGKALTPKEHWPHHKDHNLLGVKPLDDLSWKLHIPNEYYEMAKMVILYHNDIHHLYRHGAEGVVDLLEKLDGFRRPERVKVFINCCKCDFLGRKGFENRPFPRAEYLTAIFALCLGVKAKEFVDQGLSGPQIKDAIRAKRIRLTEDFMKHMPKSELDDSANSMPPHHTIRH